MHLASLRAMIRQLETERERLDFALDGLNRLVQNTNVQNTNHTRPVGRPRKKLHWTQTPEGKARFLKLMRKAKKRRAVTA